MPEDWEDKGSQDSEEPAEQGDEEKKLRSVKEDDDGTLHTDNGWKILLLVQFEAVFQILVMVCCFVSYGPTLCDAIFYFCDASDVDYESIHVVILFFLDIIYFFDTLSMAIYKSMDWEELKFMYNARPSLSIIFDFISLLPIDGLYHVLAANPNQKIILIIRLRYITRVHRIFQKLVYIENDIGISGLVAAFIQFACTLILSIITFANIEYLINCYDVDCDTRAELIKRIYSSTTKVAIRGSTVRGNYSIYSVAFFTFANILAFFYMKCYIVAKFISVLKQNMQPWAVYSNRLAEIFSAYVVVFKNDKLLKATCENYYALFWRYRHGMRFAQVQGVIPNIMITEMMLDLAWITFQHSHLFRKEEMHFLQHLSAFCKQTFMIPGELLYQKSQVKDKMAYLVAGVVQIYSEEDGETPILAFSSGTVFGEMSLILSYNSTCTVVCSTYCEFCILERKDFLKVGVKYPGTFGKLRNRVYQRLKKAQQYVEVCDYERYRNKIADAAGVVSIKRVKLWLRKLLSRNENYLSDFMKELELDERLWFESVNKLVFCSFYLDLLVLAPEEEYQFDSIFVRASFPYVFQPESNLLRAWNLLVAIMLLILIFAFPYFTLFCKDDSGLYNAFIYCVTVIWIIDVYIQISTAIDSGMKTITKLSEISVARAANIGFFLDIVAAIPIELIVFILSGASTYNVRHLLQLNRMLKLPHIGTLFKSYKDSITHDLVWYRYMKYCAFCVFIIYWGAGLYHLLLRIEDPKNSVINYIIYVSLSVKKPYEELLGCLYLSTKLMTGLAFHLPTLTKGMKGQSEAYYIPLTITLVLISVFYVIFIADITSAETLKARGKLIVQERLEALKFIMDNLDTEYVDRIHAYFDHQWFANRGRTIIYPNSILYDMPISMFQILQYNFLAETMLKIPLFQEIEKSLLMSMCASIKILDIPPGQIMTYSGEVSGSMYIIDAGYCNQISADDQITTIIGPGDSFAVVECCMRVPLINTVVTRTSCRLFALSYEAFNEAISPYSERCGELKNVVEQCMLTIRFEEGRSIQDENVKKNVVKKKPESFVSFGYKLPPNSDEAIRYHSPFEHLGYWGFVRYLLMRITFTSYGEFIRWWEIFRCIFAFLSAVLFSLPVLRSLNINPTAMEVLLDFTAYVDIYVRHHVCYFNDQGIEVTHPLTTAAHYWSHALLIDVIGSIPIRPIVVLATGSHVPENYLIFTGLNRVLQTYRIWKFFQFKISDVKANLRLLVPLRWVPFCFIMTFYLGNVVLRFTCVFSRYINPTKLFRHQVYCETDSWIGLSSFKKPMSAIKVYLYGIYYVASIVTAVGLQGFDVETVTEAITVSILALAGFFAFEFITASIIGINLSRNTDLMLYQHDMSSLMQFFTYKRIDQKIKDEIIEHFEYEFRKKRGKQYLDIMSCFNNALKEDIMYNLFGQTLSKSIIFENANLSFCRSLLLAASHEIIIRRGVISRVNDVHGTIFFVHKGMVDVLAPDYSQLLVLPAGSLFGNLDEIPFGRRTLTMVARGHVELLRIKTGDFYKILHRYTRLYAHFRKLTAIHTDYLAGGKLIDVEKAKEMSKSTRSIDKKRSSKFGATIKTRHSFFFRVRYRTTAMMIWEVCFLIMSFIGFSVQIYQMAILENSVFYIVFMYVLDLLHLITIYLKFQTVYEDDLGMTVKELKLIARNYIHSYQFYFDVVSIVPIEIFCLIFINQAPRKDYYSTMFLVWTYIRCNRLLRVLSVMQFLHKMSKKINVNVYVTRMLTLVIWMLIILQMFTFVIIKINCVSPKNSFPKLQCDLFHMTSRERFELHLLHWIIIVSIITGTKTIPYYPISKFLIGYTIVLMVFSRIVRALFVSEACATFEVTMYNKNVYSYTVNQLSTHIRTLNISRPLHKRFIRYCRLLWNKQRGLLFPKLLDQAPYYLREAALNSMFGAHIRRHPVLRGCHMDLVRQMTEKMRTNSYFPGDYITYKGDIDESMYFIHEGTVAALSEDSMFKEIVDNVLVTGEMFGFEQGMYPQVGHVYTYKAVKYCIIVILQRSRWIHLLDFFPASKILIYEDEIAKKEKKKRSKM